MKFEEELKKICEEFEMECPTFWVERDKVSMDFKQTFVAKLPNVELFNKNLRFIVNRVSEVRYDYHLGNNAWFKEISPWINNIEFIDKKGDLVELSNLIDEGVPQSEFLDKIKPYLEEIHEQFASEVSNLKEDYEYFLWSETL